MCITGAILGGALISGAAANKAAGKQANAAKNTVQLQENVYKDISGKLQPFLDAGTGALNPYLYELGLAERPEGYGGLSMSPAGQFALEQGRGTIEAGAAGRGGLFSGSTAKGLEDYRQRVAVTDRDNQLNRLFGLMQTGQQAAAGQGSAGVNFANQAGNAMQAGANAQSAGIIGMGNAANDAIGNYVSYQNFNKLLSLA